ncbi:MAG: response regulator, partial [Candidatus Eremiobacterota bacterium]
LNVMAEQLQQRIRQEKAERNKLQHRVKGLLDFTERVMEGDLTGQAPVEDDDEMGQLAMGVNETVRHLRILLEEERSMRRALEASRHELQRANEKLKELDTLKSEFLNTVSHELRTPLTSIKAFAEILLDNRGEDVETQMEFLEIINKESDRLTRLINNLLDLSRIEAGRMQWEMEPVDMHDVITAAAASMRGSADKKGVVFEVLAESKLPLIGDRDKLIQVMTNLIGNAIKFTPEGGRVRVLASRTGSNQVEVVVEDSGLGIAPEHHQKIFEKFGQVDSSETREIKGTGLGLPIARSIVEAHQGTLTVDSELGRGSRFILRLQLQEDAPLPLLTLPRHRLADWGLGRRVLVVDDEVNIRRFLRHVLELEGYQVVEARTGEEALELALKDRPDLICLDVFLPDVNGLEILTRLKARPETRGIPVIIISIVEDQEKLFRLGAADFLAKPIDKERLLERVTYLMTWSNEAENDLLLVDDDPAVLAALNAVFQSRGYRVRTAAGGEEALAMVRASRPDLILLDLKMPGVTGHDVLTEIKKDPATASIPIVILTAAPRDDRTRALGMGANTVLTKPFSEKELAGLVRAILTEAAIAPGGADEEPEYPANETGASVIDAQDHTGG